MQAKEIISQLYADYGKGDMEAVLDRCSDDFSFLFVADPQFARYSGLASDKQGFRDRAAALHGDFEYQGFRLVDMVAEGDRVVVRTEISMKRRTTGREFVMHAADFWTLRDGRAVALIEYHDTALASQFL